MHIVIGTAGHIDHGKSALVKALTGTDPDRLKEEKERGMTTDLGFAFYGPNVTVIDVPGHERFVRHMLAGATTVDFVLLVVAADDGVMPQTIEHFEITRLLGIRQGITVITKRDLVDEEWLTMIKSDIAAMVKGSFLEGAPMIAVSSVTGSGIPELKAELDRQIAQAARKSDRGIFRLPIDRNFVMKGFGTVVAGTVLSGTARVGDRVELLPEGTEARIRGIQVHNQAVAAAGLGDRAALNLQGIEREQVLRGSVLATPGYYQPTSYLNAEFYYLQSAPKLLKNMTRVRIHHGTAEVLGRVVLLAEKELQPGQKSLVQLRLETPVVADWGDRYVVRTYSPQRTIGGGAILEANPVKARRFDRDLIARLKAVGSGSSESIAEQHLLNIGYAVKTAEQVAREKALSPADATRVIDALLASGKLRRLESEGKHFLIHTGAYLKGRSLILDALGQFHRENPARLGMRRQELKSKLPTDFSPVLFDRLLEELVSENALVQELERLRLPSHSIRLDEREKALAERIERIYDEAGFNAPTLKELQEKGDTPRRDVPFFPNPKQVEKVMTALFDLGRLIDVGEGIILARRCIESAEAKVREHFARNEQMTASEFRQMVATSRKYAIPLLNYFDSHGLTHRRGDVRILKTEPKPPTETDGRNR
jgi:selenocysteine-specific elongation factor